MPNNPGDRLDVLSMPVETIQTPLFLPSFEEAFTFVLTSHGIQIEQREGEKEEKYNLLTFPEGSMKSEVLLRTHDEKYLIRLPDGFEINEVIRRGSPYSSLQINPSAIPERFRRALIEQGQLSE